MQLAKFLALSERGATALALIAGVSMSLHVSADVLARVVLGHGLVGTIESVSYFYMTAVSFLPLARVQAQRDHIVADSIAAVIPKRLQPFTDFLGKLLAIAIVAMLLWASIDTALSKTEIGELVLASTFDLPIWPARWFLPAGLFGMLVVMLLQLRDGPDEHSGSLPIA